jgi:hypothetical protein
MNKLTKQFQDTKKDLRVLLDFPININWGFYHDSIMSYFRESGLTVSELLTPEILDHYLNALEIKNHRLEEFLVAYIIEFSSMNINYEGLIKLNNESDYLPSDYASM